MIYEIDGGNHAANNNNNNNERTQKMKLVKTIYIKGQIDKREYPHSRCAAFGGVKQVLRDIYSSCHDLSANEEVVHYVKDNILITRQNINGAICVYYICD